MKNILKILIVIILTSSCSIAYSAEFSDYPGAKTLTSKPVKPKLVTHDQRRHRTAIREASALGPNFNGHYHLAEWGCGTNCVELALINLENGNVSMLGVLPICEAPPKDDKGEIVDSYTDIETNIKSRLFYAYDCQNSEDDACPNYPNQNRRHSFILKRNKIIDIGVECLVPKPSWKK